MHSRAQALSQPAKADRRLKLAPVTDALGVIQNVALIHDRRRVAKGKRLGVLLRCCCLINNELQLIERMIVKQTDNALYVRHAGENPLPNNYARPVQLYVYGELVSELQT